MCSGGEEDMYKEHEADCCVHHIAPNLTIYSTIYSTVTVDTNGNSVDNTSVDAIRGSKDNGTDPKVPVALGILFGLALLMVAVFVILFIVVSM